jgi:hypothetical protein
MRIVKGFLFFYSFCLSIVIAFGTIITGLRSGNLIFIFIFLPVVVYFALTILRLERGTRLLLYYSFVLTTIMAVMGFVGTQSTPELLSAGLFLPMAFYFWSLALPRRNKKLPIPAEVSLDVVKAEIEEGRAQALPKALPAKNQTRNLDADRRMFLKLIGSAGLTLFFFAVFTRRAQAAFFGSVPGPGTVAIKDTTGAQIDPAIKHPTDGYRISQIDDSTPAYYGYLNKDGAWFIMKEDSNGDYRYAKGNSNFSTNWANRTSLTYDYFDAVF